MNPLAMMKIGERIRIFGEQHPRAVSFLKNLSRHGISEGSILELKVINSDGQEFLANIRITQEDLKTLEMFKHANES